MSDTIEGYGPLAEKKYTDKELKIFIKFLDMLVEVIELAEDIEPDEAKDVKEVFIEQMDNMIYNATKLKELL
jgi:hypothetical protein